MASKRKQDEKHLNILRGMAKLDHNKHCLDCSQRGPTYLNMTIGAFVCTSCSGLLRGLNPPHRIKSISMASFTPEEIDFIRKRGNDFCNKVWLGLHETRTIDLVDKDENKIKDSMVLKYEKKRYYVAPTEAMMEQARQQNTPQKSEPQTTRSFGNIPSLRLQQQKVPVSSENTPQSGHTTAVPKPVATQPPPLSVGATHTRPGGGLDLLGELGADPFASNNFQQQQQQQQQQQPQQQQPGFADFGSFGPVSAQQQQPVAQRQMPHSLSQPTGFTPNNNPGVSLQPTQQTSQQPPLPTTASHSNVVQSNSFGAFSSPSLPAPTESLGDKYGALAELDSVFGGASSGAKNVDWNASNPFQSTEQSNTAMPANPFSSSGASFANPQPSGFHQQPGGFGRQVNSTDAFSMQFDGKPVSNMGTGQFSGTNGVPQQPPPMWGGAGPGMGAPPQQAPGFGASPQFNSGAAAFPAKPLTQDTWMNPQPTANPFMNIASQQQPSRPLNSTNPFL